MKKTEKNKLNLRADADVALFDISDPEQKAAYVEIVNDVANKKKELKYKEHLITF